MNFRQTIREHWDVGFLVTAIGLILGWALFVALVSPLLGQTAPRAIVTWDELADAAKFNVKRGTSATSIAPIGETAINSYKDETLEPTIRYYFAVAGVDAQNQEGYTSDVVPFRFSDIQPASPANVTCTQTRVRSTVTLNCSWGQVTKTRSLLLVPSGAVVTYRGFMTNTGTIQQFSILQGRSITISGVPRHRTFYFYVTAVWNGIESLGSPAVRIQT